MPLPPVAALHEPRQEVDRQGEDGVASQGQGDSVQALLPNLKQVALALILCGFRVPTVPLGGVLQTRAQQSEGTGQVHTDSLRHGGLDFWVVAFRAA